VTALYLIQATCPRCGDLAALVEETPDAVNLDHDVPIDTRWCPECGEHVRMGEWDVHAESRIVTVEEPVSTAERQPSNPVERAVNGLGSGVSGGIELAPCPECGSFRTYWDELADEDVESGTCDDCHASFALSETVRINEDDLRGEFL